MKLVTILLMFASFCKKNIYACTVCKAIELNKLYVLLPQEHREAKKRLEEIVDDLKKELSTAEHQLQKNNMEIKVLTYF